MSASLMGGLPWSVQSSARSSREEGERAGSPPRPRPSSSGFSHSRSVPSSEKMGSDLPPDALKDAARALGEFRQAVRTLEEFHQAEPGTPTDRTKPPPLDED